jgi:hypothetical protein
MLRTKQIRISGKCRKVVQFSTVSILHYFIMVRVRGGLNRKLCREWRSLMKS